VLCLTYVRFVPHHTMRCKIDPPRLPSSATGPSGGSKAEDRPVSTGAVRYVVQRARPAIFRLSPRTRLFGARAWLLRAAGYDVAPSAQCVSTVEFHAPRVALGENVFCAHQVRFFGGPASSIRVGPGAELGPGVMVVARTHHIGPPNHRAGADEDTSIEIGEGVWVGAGAVIIGPCVIGPGTVIAAGSTVRGDVSGNVLHFGFGGPPDRPLSD
jgi:maltose O-acetyltransferase